jgi:hypothetical protein
MGISEVSNFGKVISVDMGMSEVSNFGKVISVDMKRMRKIATPVFKDSTRE